MREEVRRIRDSIQRSIGRRTDRPFRHTLFENNRSLNTLAYHWSSRGIRRRQAAEESLDEVLTTVLDVQPGWPPYRLKALQLRPEFEEFTRFVAGREPETVLEIGLFLGGTLYVWARALGTTEHLVSVDQPVWNELVHRRRSKIYSGFSSRAQIDIHYGNSHAERTYTEISERFEERVDFLFIDGDHTYEGVKQDFEMYRRLVGDDGIIAFHDIKRHARNREEKQTRLQRVDDLEERCVTVGDAAWGVSEFWAEVQREHDTREFLTHSNQMGAGIGIIEF